MIDQTTIGLASAQKPSHGNLHDKASADQKKANKGFADLVFAKETAATKAGVQARGDMSRLAERVLGETTKREQATVANSRIELSSKLQQAARSEDGLETGAVVTDDTKDPKSRTTTAGLASKLEQATKGEGQRQAIVDDATRPDSKTASDAAMADKKAKSASKDTEAETRAQADAKAEAISERVDAGKAVDDDSKIPATSTDNESNADQSAAEGRVEPADNAASEALEQLQKADDETGLAEQSDTAGVDPFALDNPDQDLAAASGNEPATDAETVSDLPASANDSGTSGEQASLSEELNLLLGLPLAGVSGNDGDVETGDKPALEGTDAETATERAQRRPHHHGVASASDRISDDSVAASVALAAGVSTGKASDSDLAGSHADKPASDAAEKSSDSDATSVAIDTDNDTAENSKPATAEIAPSGESSIDSASAAASAADLAPDDTAIAETGTNISQTTAQTTLGQTDGDFAEMPKTVSMPRDRADTDIRVGSSDTLTKSDQVDPRTRAVATDEKSDRIVVEGQKARKDDTTSSAASSRTDFIMVLESRRYLGFSSDSNASALTSTITSDGSWANALREAAIDGPGTVTEVNTLKLKMNPEHLGGMTASLRLKGDELSVEVRVETVEAYRQMTTDQEGILRALQDQGFSIDQVSVQLSPSAKTDGGQDASSQQNNGQNLREGQSDNGRQRDENARRASTHQDSWTGHEQTSSQGDSSSIADSSTRNLYL